MINKILKIWNREGFGSVKKKASYRLNYYLFRLSNSNREEEKRWRGLKNKFTGKRAFLIGNGPSLNKTPLYLLKDEYVMCFNRFYVMEERLNFSPNFFTCVDNLVLKDLVPEIPDLRKKYEYLFFPDRHFRKTNFKALIGTSPNFHWLQPIFGQGFSKQLPKVNQGGSVIYEGMQILSYLGFDEIIVLGVDMNFKIHETAKKVASKNETDIKSIDDDDPNHFDPRYFGKNRSYHQPEKFVIDNILDNLNFLGKNLDHYNLNIINAGYDSKVDAFPKADFFNQLGFPKSKIDSYFRDLITEKAGMSGDAFELKYPRVNDIDLKNLPETSFYTNSKSGAAAVGKLIHHFLPLGPWENKYYFILRTTIIK